MITTSLEKNKMNLATMLLLATTVLSGLVAGLLYAFVCAIKPGLGSLDDRMYLKAMQSINHAIENPLFFLSFMGTMILLAVISYMNYNESGFSNKTIIILISATIYVIGVFGVTMTGNMPLNNFLANIDIMSLSNHDLSLIRTKIEEPWNYLHQIRTLASFISFVILVFTCLFYK